MTTTRHSDPGPAHHQRTVAVLRFLAVLSLALPILMLFVGGQLAWLAKKQQALDNTVRLNDLLYESASKLIDAQLMATEQARLLVGTLDDDAVAASQLDIHTHLKAMLRYLPHLRDVYLVNRSGHSIVDATRFPAPSVNNVSKRDYFRYFRDGGTGLFIGAAGSRMMDNLPFIPLAVQRPSLNGEFTGVIATSINPEYFQELFRQVLSAYPDSAGRMITLQRGDGRILVGSAQLSPDQEAVAAAEVADAIKPPAESGRSETGKSETGKSETGKSETGKSETGKSGAAAGQYVSSWPGETRLAAWRRLQPVDMVVVSSVSLRTVVADWLGTMLPYAVFGLFGALALFSITLVALRRTHHAEEAERRAAQEQQRRQQAEEAVRQSQKMEALGQLTGGVAHDFNNLLAVIQGNAELAKTRPPEKVAKLIDNIVHAAQRGAALTRQLLSFSRGQSLQPRVMQPQSEIPRLLELLKPSLRGNIQLKVQVPGGIWPVEIDPGEWEIAMLNIAVNARDAMPDGGTFAVTACNELVARGDIATAPDLAGEFVAIALADTGAGIPQDVATRAFEPFFTTKGPQLGTGLGLSQVYGFARQAGGAATIEPRKSGGTVVTLYLPRTRNISEPAGAVESWYRNHDSSGKRILLVEDNHEVAAITTEIIETLGYEVICVDRARKALDILQQPDVQIHLLLTDVVMPGEMNGLELAHRARAQFPALPIILMSGYNEAIAGHAEDFRILRKPLPAEQLARALFAELRATTRAARDTAKAG
jgi:two-component system NtrC family sensor kinase